MKNKLSILIAVLLLGLVGEAFGAFYSQDFNTTSSINTPATSQFRVDAIKYEPYPVNAGDYFDLWIKVENIGSQDATNSVFTLMPKYPFSSTDNLVREYGTVKGSSGKENEENQVVLKYRIKAAEDAPEGSNEIDFKVSSGGISGREISKKFQIEIGRTKTDFDIVMQDSSEQGTSLAIANIGENPATAVTVRINDQEGFTVSGAQASIIGNLDTGDFTTVTFQIAPKKAAGTSKELTVQIEYTDIAGVRNMMEKKVPVDIVQSGFSGTTDSNSATGTAAQRLAASRSTAANQSFISKILYGNTWTSRIFYALAGIAIALIVITVRDRRRKRRE